MTAPQLLDLNDVAALLKISRDSVETLVHNGQLAAVDVRAEGTRPRLRIAEDELARFVAARALPSIKPAPGVSAMPLRRRARGGAA